MKFNDLYENVQTWVHYNPEAAVVIPVALVFLVLAYLIFRRKPAVKTKKQGDVALVVLDNGTRMSQKRPGRIVPQFCRGDKLSDAVRKVLDVNHNPTIEEIIDLFDEGGFSGNWSPEHTRDRIYAVLCTLKASGN